jgi:cytochrome c biogenesis protein CcmG/thiol:disulfide interchange protein DsbE
VGEGRSNILRLLPVLIFVAVAGFFAMALRSGDPNLVPSTLVGRQAPATTFPPVDGLEVDGSQVLGFSSADLAKGQVSVVNFWASWCQPCVEEHPLLVQLKRDSGVEIYGVNYKDKASAARHFISRYGNPFTAVGSDAEGRGAIEWGVYGMPETFVVDGTGKVVYKHVGPISSDSMATKLLPAIEKARGLAVTP